MKIINKTHWNTRSIWKLLSAALKRHEKIEGKFERRHCLEVIIVYSKKRWFRDEVKSFDNHPDRHFTGCAQYSSHYMTIRVPRERMDSRVFARVFDHELYHCRGWKHNKLGVIGGRFLNLKTLEEDNWALEYPIVPKDEKPEIAKPKVNLQLKRYNHVLALLKDKKSKFKRLQNQIKKWTQKRKYYERILVANGKIKKEQK